MSPRLLAALALLLAACSSDSSPSQVSPARVCTPGQQVECPCPGGEQGAQACKSDGSAYESCQCGTAGAGGTAGTAGSGGTGADGGTGGTGGTAGTGGSAGSGGVAGQGGVAGTGGSAGEGGTSGAGGTSHVATWNAAACDESAATCSGQKAPCCEKAAASLAVRDSHGYCGTFEDSCGNPWKCDTCSAGDECLPDPVDSMHRLGCYTPCTQRASCPDGYCGPAQSSCWTCPHEPAQDYISTWARNKLQPVGCTLGGGLNGSEEIWCCQ